MISCKDYLLLLGEGITFSDSFERLRPCDDAQKFLWTPARSPLRPHFRSRLRSLLRVGSGRVGSGRVRVGRWIAVTKQASSHTA
ncbi:hypothetical protein H9Q70_011929 [Fusarium xylarioides]|nr:hypothetical protein H9Q70_011929 [Fusarium xylarioides]